MTSAPCHHCDGTGYHLVGGAPDPEASCAGCNGAKVLSVPDEEDLAIVQEDAANAVCQPHLARDVRRLVAEVRRLREVAQIRSRELEAVTAEAARLRRRLWANGLRTS